MSGPWEKVSGEETWTHGNWTVSDHDGHWHIYWCDDPRAFNDWPLTLAQAETVVSRLDNVLAWSLRSHRP
jgi:hypothetical protein